MDMTAIEAEANTAGVVVDSKGALWIRVDIQWACYGDDLRLSEIQPLPTLYEPYRALDTPGQALILSALA